jgi:DNA-3-methyladenine glycosylase
VAVKASPAGSAPLAAAFYDRPVLEVAPELLGCAVWHGETAGLIVEAEAYHEEEPASHAFVGLTPRTRVLCGEPGRAYVYRSYGIHAMLNAVCEPVGIGAGVLIRALAPLAGIDRMRARRGLSRTTDLCSGPGKLTQALGIKLQLNGTSLADGPIVIRARAPGWEDPAVVVSRRVGITKATELPWRFTVAGDPNVSRPRPR